MASDTPKPAGKKAPLWSKIVVSLGAVLLVASAGAFAFGTNLLNTVNDIQQEDIIDNNADAVEGPQNLLLLGADLREESGEPARADTIMILHVDENHQAANIVSIPRDLLVDIADCGEGQPCQDKINAAYTFGGDSPAEGASNMAATITDLTGIDFSGVAIVNFEGFLDVVKEFDGIELCLPHDLNATHGDYYEEGCERYKPDDALAIVRERYEWEDGDYGRQAIQQHFIKQLLKEADEQGYIRNPVEVGGLVKQIGDQLILDLGENISPVDYATAMSDVKPGDLKTIQLPSEPAEIDGTSYVVMQEGQQQQDAEALFEAVNDDSLDEWIKENPDYLNKDPADE